jgi:hypothetical protein
LAFKYVADGTVTHADIPDDPTTESERRQFVFAAAMGVQACSVRQHTANRLMTKLLAATKKTRPSRRYPGYVRVKLADYCRALLRTIEDDAGDLIESLGLRETLDLLRLRLDDPQHYAASGKLTAGILGEVGATSPMKLSGSEFNLAAEDYYRETLRKRHMDEALRSLLDDLRDIDGDHPRDHRYRRIASQIIGTERARDFLDARKADLMAESLDEGTLAQCIRLTLLAVQRDRDLVAARTGIPSSC